MKKLNDVLNEITSDILSEAPGLIQRGSGTTIPAPSFLNNSGVVSRPVGDPKDLAALRFQRALGSLKSSVPQTTRLLRDAAKNGEIEAQRKALLNPGQQKLPERQLISQNELNARQHLYDINKKVTSAASDVSRQAQEKQAAEEAQLHALHKSQEGTPGFDGATETLPPDLSDVAEKYNKAKMLSIAKTQLTTQSKKAEPSETPNAPIPPATGASNSPTPPPASASTGTFGDYLDNAKRSVLELGDKFTKGATGAGNYLGQKASELGDWISKNPEWAAGGLGAALAAGAGALYLRKKMKEKQRNSASY